MADVQTKNENALPSKNNIATNDLIRIIGSNNASYKALVSDVAKCIVENYAGSSLAGSAQSIQAAFTALNSNALQTSGSNHKLITTFGIDFASFRFIDQDENFSQIVFYDSGRVSLQRHHHEQGWLPEIALRNGDG